MHQLAFPVNEIGTSTKQEILELRFLLNDNLRRYKSIYTIRYSEADEISSYNDEDKIEILEELNKENTSMDEPFDEDTVVTDEETGTKIDDDLDVKKFKVGYDDYIVNYRLRKEAGSVIQ
uniref:Uncharacterized protein n=1 Tax=Rhizophagus irregularis (strain DAOM 181602 / DAOM 197198 / MUCL 43194) TaxID=747089 RepID=U9T6V9_RHIID